MAVGDLLRSVEAPQAIPVVRRLLREMETEALRAAISSLSQHADLGVVLELRTALGHREGVVRVDVAQALAARGLCEVVPAIMAQFEVEEDALNRDALRAAVRLLQG